MLSLALLQLFLKFGLSHGEKTNEMKNGFLTLVVLCAFVITLNGQVANRSSLTIPDIMTDNYTGHHPTQPRWANDSKTLYFTWNPAGERTGDTYQIDPNDPKPVKADRSEMQKRIPETGIFDSDRRRKLELGSNGLCIIDLKKHDTLLLISVAGRIGSYGFSHSGEKVTFLLDNQLCWIDLKTGQFRQLTNFQGEKPKSPQREEESINQQDLWLMNDQMRLFPKLGGQRGRQDFRSFGQQGRMAGGGSSGPRPFYTEGFSVQTIQLSPDERFVTYVMSWPAPERSRPTIMPDYVTRSGYTEPRDTRSKVGNLPGHSNLGILDLSTGKHYQFMTDSIPGICDLPDYAADYPDRYKNREPEPRKVYVSAPNWSPNGKHAVVSVRSADNKDLWLLKLNPADGSFKLLDRQRDEAWVGGPGIGYGRGGNWMPDGERLWFQSEESGYSHLYLLDVNTATKKALTSGDFEVYNPFISKNQKFWFFTSNEVHPGERHLYRMPLEGGARERITGMTGGNEVTLSPDEKWLAISFSAANLPPEIYLQPNKPGAEAIQITDSRSDAFKSYSWRIPEYVSFDASDGAKVYARLYKPEGGEANGAAVIFVHGAGYLQNAHKWWSTYEREYRFHNLLVDNGYTVLDIDYRGSSGYGRDCRTGIYRHMGGKDLSDHVDGADFLIGNHGIDPARIGIYGGSYGGFITLMAMFNEPGRFAAGAALRSVTDWAHYNHGYTANILNTPVEDSIAYHRSSPINFAEGLQGRLLMCHGVLDDNVHFQDIVRLTQRLIDLGKENWELAIYPLERHSFTDPAAWTDEYRRIFRLFQETINSQHKP